MLKDAPKFVFSTNVFKQNVKLASPEETTSDEALVKDLARFLRED